MKLILKMMVILLLGMVAGCGEKEKALYDQVMDIHDEVMPKMENIHTMKRLLQDSIANTPGMTDVDSVKIARHILQLDSGYNSMMVWMREFNPPDQQDKQAFDKYMETELVKVKKMREDVMRALEGTGK